MIKILVLGDDYIWQSKIEQMLYPHQKIKIVGFAECISKGRDMLENLHYDLIIADVYLGRHDVLNLFEDKPTNIPIIFISNSDEKAIFNAIQRIPMAQYLVKPFHEFTLMSSINQSVLNYLKNEEPYFVFKLPKTSNSKLYIKNITNIEAEGNYSIFYTTDGKKFAKKISLTKVLNGLEKYFVRVNKNTIVNRSKIIKIDFTNFKIYTQDKELVIGRKFIANVNNLELK